MPKPLGELGEGEDVGSGGVEVLIRVGELSVDIVQETVELRV